MTTTTPPEEHLATDAEFEAALQAAKAASRADIDAAANAQPGETRIAAVDSLTANEFRVELSGEPVTGVFRVAGLTPFKLDVKPAVTKQVREPFRVYKMVQRDPNAPFNRWLQETQVAGANISRPTRDLDVIAVDDGVETRRWTFRNAWVTEIAYSDFDTGSGELVQEIITVQYDDVQESWPGAQG